MKTNLLTAIISTLLAGTALAAPQASPAPAPTPTAAVVPVAELFGVPFVDGFKLKLPGGDLQITAACVCEEWTTIVYKPCLKYSEDGSQCLKYGPEVKRKCCSRTSCGANEC